jgi:hypothetical protein
MKVKLKKVTIEVNRPFCPKCGAELTEQPGNSLRFNDDLGSYAEKQCDCSIWAWVADLDLDRVDRFKYLGPKK